MAILKLFNKPNGFDLPREYRRLPWGESGHNCSYCIGKRSDIDNFNKYEIWSF